MFSTRLNPTKPPAAHRAILERIGAACREIRPIEDECCANGQVNSQAEAVLEKHGVMRVGTPVDRGGSGSDPLLLVLVAERIGREGVRLVRWFTDHAAGNDPLQRFLCLAAGGIGVIADCLETTALFCAERTNRQATDEPPSEIDHYVTLTACDLEATRAITYAAAELKAELDRHPHSPHLQLEAGTLIREALLLSLGAMSRMFDRAQSLAIGGRPIADWLPLRHRMSRELQMIEGDLAGSLTKQIARFYLLE